MEKEDDASSGAEESSSASDSPAKRRRTSEDVPEQQGAAATAAAAPTSPTTSRAVEPEAAAGEPKKAAEELVAASSSSESDSDEESASSSSSSSESEVEAFKAKAVAREEREESEEEEEEEAEPAPAVEEAPPPPVEDEETRKRRELALLRAAQLRRDEIAKFLLELPEREAENAVVRAFVRLTAAQSGCVLAEVGGLERCAPYQVPLKGDRGVDPRIVSVQLKCRRGASTRLIKITSVSNQEATEAELEQWRRLSQRTGVEGDFYLEQMRQKALDIAAARSFRFDELAVSRHLDTKPSMEFDAQKESRMRFLVQCAISQMDISGIRENEAEELATRYQEAVKGLSVQEQRSADVQEAWFEKRPNLFSLKMINQKNVNRQTRDDRHALHFALNEETSAAALNPFQRRACRPVVAWDTKLTAVEGLGGDSAAAAAAEPTSQAAASASVEPDAAQQPAPMPEGSSRVGCVVRAHRNADLLSKLGPLFVAAGGGGSPR